MNRRPVLLQPSSSSPFDHNSHMTSTATVTPPDGIAGGELQQRRRRHPEYPPSLFLPQIFDDDDDHNNNNMLDVQNDVATTTKPSVNDDGGTSCYDTIPLPTPKIMVVIFVIIVVRP